MIELRHLLTFARQYFTNSTPLAHVLATFTSLFAAQPLFRLHRVQLTASNRHSTAWLQAARSFIKLVAGRSPNFYSEDNNELDLGIANMLEDEDDALLSRVSETADTLRLGLDGSTWSLDGLQVPMLLVSSHTRCLFCTTNGIYKPLQCRKELVNVTFITAAYTKISAMIAIPSCTSCGATYYPDRVVRKNGDVLEQFYINNAEHIRISKPAKLWVSRSIAIAQAQSIVQHQSFSGYAAWFNKTYGASGFIQSSGSAPSHSACPTLTSKQSYRMFVEHMVRVLGVAQEAEHGGRVFHTPFNPDTETLVRAAVAWFAQDGVLPGALEHTCTGCTHAKCYQVGAAGGGDSFGVAEVDDTAPELPELEIIGVDQAGDDIMEPRQELQPVSQDPRVVRMAVLDGKVVGHLLCNAGIDPPCRNPPSDFKSARFCVDHDDLNDVCGLVGCSDPVAQGSKVCSRQSHQDFYQKWATRFGRSSMASVQRLLQRREEARQDQTHGNPVLPQPPLGPMPTLPDDDPALMEPGANIKHTFQAGRVYCAQIITWACGMPIAATKFYESESESQVVSFLNQVWPEPAQRPDYLAYDRACFILRHLVTQHIHSSWLRTTRFIVDAWHYIGHRADDLICRTRCNPAPTDGSQPDLVEEILGEDGRSRQRRKFNTEAAEQLNAWFDGFKGALKRMTDYNFDFVVFCLLFLLSEDWKYRKQETEARAERVANRNRGEDDDEEDDIE